MRVCYVILCHRDPELVARLVAAVRHGSPAASVVVRHDRGAGFLVDPVFTEPGVRELASHVATSWGSWSLVEAQLEVLASVRGVEDPDWVVTLSGQDYPLLHLADWEQRVLGADVDALVNAEAVPPPAPWTGRLVADHLLRAKYHLRWRRLPRLARTPPASLRRVGLVAFHRLWEPRQRRVILNRLPRDGGWILGTPRRHTPFDAGLTCYKGDFWLALSRRALDVLLAPGEPGAGLRAHYAQTLVPDESFAATLLLNDAGLRVRRQPVSWHSFPVGSAHPGELDAVAVPGALASGVPFGRKIEPAGRPFVPDLLDAALGGRDG